VCEVVTELVCTGLGGTYQGDNEICTECLCPVALTPFIDPLPIPTALPPDTPGGTEYTIEMTEFQQQLHTQLAPTTVWGYAGSYPARSIDVTRDVPITVHWVNNLPATHYLTVDTCAHGADDQSTRTVVHLHGGHVPVDADGYPEDTFLTGNSDTYVYPNNQLPATLWYHDHALGITRLNVYMGLAGFYLIRDQVELDIGLPAGGYEIPMVIQDRSFNPDGSLCYPSSLQDHFYGNEILVNGKVQPFLDVEQATYRFRVLNGSNTRTYTLSFSNGASFDLIGSDGGLFEHPLTGLTEITLGPAERADILIDFTPYANTEFVLENSAPTHGGGAPLPEIMKFVVTGVSGPVVATPDPLRPLEILQTADSIRERFFTLRKVNEPCAGSSWLINDLGWDDITEFPRLDTTETWSFVNLSGMMHPMHMHLVMFQVVNRQTYTYDGSTVTPTGNPIPPDPTEAGWKDTVRAEPGLITRVIARFEDYTGLYPYHCHILEHEDHEMMRQFEALPACPWDFDHDNEVGIVDFLFLLGAWGTPAGDVDGDGDTGITDFLAVLANWGPCP
jgi:spore coat protein A